MVNWLNSFWSSPDRLSVAATLFNRGLVAALGLSGLLTASIIIVGNRRDSLLRIVELAKDQKVADTNKLAAEANERAAKAELEAAKLRLELEKMRQPRRLSDEQKMKLRAFLTVQSKPTRYIPYAAPDEESLNLMRDIRGALQLAGWTAYIPESAGLIADGILLNAKTGLSLAVHRNKTDNAWLSAQLLLLVLRDDCNLEIKLHTGADDETLPTDCVLIMCGAKPL